MVLGAVGPIGTQRRCCLTIGKSADLINIKRIWFRLCHNAPKSSKPRRVRKRNHYEVLNVSADAETKEIKAAYYELSKKYHPDVSDNKEDTALFHQIKEAYDTLSDDNLRRSYDLQHMRMQGPASADVGEVFARKQRRSTMSASERHRRRPEAEEFGDIRSEWDPRFTTFKDFQSSWRARAQPPPTGKTHHYNYTEWYQMHYGDGAPSSFPGFSSKHGFYDSAKASSSSSNAQGFTTGRWHEPSEGLAGQKGNPFSFFSGRHQQAPVTDEFSFSAEHFHLYKKLRDYRRKSYMWAMFGTFTLTVVGIAVLTYCGKM